MNNFGYCYVFDYSVPAIYEIELDEQDDQEEVYDILDRRGLRESDCYVMFNDDKLSVKPIKFKDDESV